MNLQLIRSKPHKFPLALMALVLLAVGLSTGAQAQGQICRDVEQITICGDTLQTNPNDPASTSFNLVGNLRIGVKGGPMVIRVSPLPESFAGIPVNADTRQGMFSHRAEANPRAGTANALFGRIHFIDDSASAEPLLSTHFAFRPNRPQTVENVVTGFLFVDPVNGRISLPPGGNAPYGEGNLLEDVERNAPYLMNFVQRVGLAPFFRDGGTVAEFSPIDAEFDLFAKKLKTTLPIRLRLKDSAENNELQIRVRGEWNERGVFSGGVDGFKLRLAGLVMDASGVVVRAAQGGAPAEFEAATVKVLKVDNPSVPNLDPTDTTLIFQFSKLKYKEGEFSIGGVEAPVGDWELGAAFKMVNQTLGIVSEGVVQSIQVRSTLQFGSGADADKLPVVLKIGRAQDTNGQFRPVFQAGLTNFNPKLSAMTFKLKDAVFVGDSAQNFWGLRANNVDLQWPPHLGGKTALGVGSFELGADRDKNLKFKLGNGTVGLPEFENGLFKANLQATVGVVQETVVMTGTGVFSLKLRGNENSAGIVGQAILRYNREINVATPTAVAAGPARTLCRDPLNQPTFCPGATPPPPPLPPFELKLAGFELKVAGFKFNVVNPRGLVDGGFAVDSAALALPTGLSVQNNPSGGLQVQGLVVKGNGDVLIQGGGFELPPLKVGSVQLVALRGNFVKLDNGNYEFRAAGKLPMPGAEVNGGISLDVAIRTTNTGSFAGMGVKIDISTPAFPPVPLGGTGFELTRVNGSFDLTNGTSTISLGVVAESQFKISLGATLGSLPLATTTGTITAQFDPFKLSGNVTLSVLVFQVANAAVNIGAGQGFDGGQGMNAVVNVNAVLVKGEFRLRTGKGTATDPNKRRLAAAATWDLGIVKNQFGVGLPPINLGGIVISLHGGAFTDNNFSPARETIGVKGTYDGIVFNFGVFVDLKEQIGSGNFIKVRNLDKYVLIPAAAVRAAAARGELGYASRHLSLDEAQALGLVVAADADGVVRVLQDVIPIELDKTTSLVAGISYASGNPVLRLRLPGGEELTPATVDGVTSDFLTDADETGVNAFFVVRGATPGQYQLIIDNAPAEYDDVSYTLNEAPRVTIIGVTCGGPTVTGIEVTCAGGVTAAGSLTPDATNATVMWNVTDLDSTEVQVSVGLAADNGGSEAITLADVTILAQALPAGDGSHTTDLAQIGTGAYRLVVIADDDENGAVLAVSDAVLTVVDNVAPALPTGLSATPQAGELLVSWTPNRERDLAGYEIGFGLVDDPAQFIYSRDMGPKEVATGANETVDAKLWGLDDNTTIFYGLRAYDTSGNYSDWTPLQSAQPWALSPNTWTPVPNGAGVSVVEIGFAAPMNASTLEDALTVSDASGNPILGTSYLLVDFDSHKTVGVGFEPAQPVRGKVTATLKGGASGVQAEDGRTMGGDYTWSFTLTPEEIFLPLVSR